MTFGSDSETAIGADRRGGILRLVENWFPVEAAIGRLHTPPATAPK